MSVDASVETFENNPVNHSSTEALMGTDKAAALNLVEALSISQLKLLLRSQDLDLSQCVEKRDLLHKAKSISNGALDLFLQQQSKLSRAKRGCPFFSDTSRKALQQLQQPICPHAMVSKLVAQSGMKGVKSFLQSQGVNVRIFTEKTEFLKCAEKIIYEEQHIQTNLKGTDVKRRNLARVRHDIASLLRSAPRNFDGHGSYVPLLIRFAWHCCGTYDKATGTGGSNGCTMRFPAEQQDPENAGLDRARDLLKEIHDKYPWMSLADLYVLAGYVAIEASGGPPIPFSYGRRDFTAKEATAVFGPGRCPFARKDGVHNPEKSRLPAADLGPDLSIAKGGNPEKREAPTIRAIRGTFHRMGFNDQETVVLILLGHQYGRCHPENSGFTGTWYAFDPANWNIYAGGLGYLTIYKHLNDFEEVINESGKRQWNNNLFGGDPKHPAFMMLAVDMALYWDPIYRQHVQYYERHRLEFRCDAARAWKKLTQLGCPLRLLIPERNAVPMCSCSGRTPCSICRSSVR